MAKAFAKLEILEHLENPQTGKQRRIRPSLRDSRELKDFRDSRESCSEKTLFFRSRGLGMPDSNLRSAERMPQRFRYILDWYKYGHICIPATIGMEEMRRECAFFQLPDDVKITQEDSQETQPPQPERRAWITEVECQTPARSTNPNSCSTVPVT